MCRVEKVVKILSLLLLSAAMSHSQADDFPQCVNVDPDTFIMAIDDCTSYIYCNGENSFRDTCPNQTYFDGKAQECAFDDEGVCLQPIEATTTEQAETVPTVATVAAGAVREDNKQEQPEITTPQATTVPAPSATGKPTLPDGSRPHCDTAGDGFYPHPQRCEYYYSCLGGYLNIVRCPYKYGWDHAEGRCKPLAEAQCFRL